jgi:hypothetical protein
MIRPGLKGTTVFIEIGDLWPISGIEPGGIGFCAYPLGATQINNRTKLTTNKYLAGFFMHSLL